MKKIYLFGLAALALGFTACDDIEDPTGKPQSNPQLEIVQASNVKAVAGPSTTSVISLDALNATDTPVQLATVTKGEDWPEGFEPVVRSIELSKDADFTTTYTVEASMGDEGMVLVAPDAWEATYLEMYGKNPLPTTSYVRFPVYAVNGNQSVRMGSETTYYGDFAVEVKPFDLYNGRIVEDSYYLLTSDMNWDITKAIELKKQGDDVYVDGRFASSAVIVNGAGFEWMVIPATAYNAGNITAAYASFGVATAGDAEKSGSLVANVTGSRAVPGVINVAGPYLFTFDMEKLTYTVQLAYEQLYTPGNSNGWDFGGAQVLTTSDYNEYYGYAHLNGEFKFTTAPNWDGVNFGAGEEEGTLTTDGSAGNLVAPADGLYYVHANLDELTYKLTAINKINLVGGFNDWSTADAEAEMTPSADFLTWTATVTFDGNEEWKFCMNNGWDINLGGSLDNLVKEGYNIVTAEAGTYLVTLDLSAVPYTATMTKQ